MSSSNQNSGELVTLKYYDASASVVYDLAEGLTFTSDETLGNINSPEIFNVAQVSNNYYFDCGSYFACQREYPNQK